MCVWRDTSIFVSLGHDSFICVACAGVWGDFNLPPQTRKTHVPRMRRLRDMRAQQTQSPLQRMRRQGDSLCVCKCVCVSACACVCLYPCEHSTRRCYCENGALGNFCVVFVSFLCLSSFSRANIILYMYIYVYIHDITLYMYVYIYIYIYIWHRNICIPIYIYIFICIYILFNSLELMQLCILIYIYIYTHTYTYICTYIHLIHVCTCKLWTNMHICIHMYYAYNVQMQVNMRARLPRLISFFSLPSSILSS